jgi:FkbM family methyltransferase
MPRSRLAAALPRGRELTKKLRPAVALERARDRLDWLRISRALEVTPRADLARFGTGYGGYVIPQGLPSRGWRCYSGGLGNDVSFELALIARYGCTVHGFDPTPRSVQYAARISKAEPRFHVHPFGLWSADSEQRFYAPRDGDHVSHSIQNLQRTATYFTARCRRVSSVMAELGHERLDLLKLDIEGAEYAVLDSLAEDGIEPKLLVIDVHPIPTLQHAISALRSLRRRGYVPLHVYRSDVTFLHESLQ